MVLAVPPANWQALEALCASEGVEATVLGTFEPTGRLRLSYQGEQVADLDMHFLHDGRPAVVRQATWTPGAVLSRKRLDGVNVNDTLLRILASYNVCSKEWIIRRYDHEV